MKNGEKYATVLSVAVVAQVVEQLHGKEQVISANLINGSPE